MRRAKLPADHTGQPMHRAEARIRQRQTARQADIGHRIPRGRVFARRQTFERGNPLRNRGTAERIGQRVGLARKIGLDHLHQGIKPRPQGHPARRTIRQRGIDQGQTRQHSVVAQADFSRGLRHGDNGVLGDLGPGARGGRDRDHRQRVGLQRLALAHDFEMLHHVAIRRDQRRCGFGKVDHRAAAHAQHHLRPAPCQSGRADIIDRGFAAAADLGHVTSSRRQVTAKLIDPSDGTSA